MDANPPRTAADGAMWLTPAQAAELIPGTVSARTVQRWAASGRLPATRLPNGRLLINRFDLISNVGPCHCDNQPVRVPRRAPSPLVSDVPDGYKAGRSGGVYPLQRGALTPRHFAILEYYRLDPLARQSDIAAALTIPQSTVSAHYRDLVAKGLLVVEDDTGSTTVREPESVSDAMRARFEALAGAAA